MQTFFFDLDNTLYPHTAGVTEALEEKMNAYVAMVTKLPIPDAAVVRQGYFRQYGTTLRGLQIHHEIDTEAYLAAVHDIPIETLIQRNHDLWEAVKPMRAHSAIFTNSPREHAIRVLRCLGFVDDALPIIDIRSLQFHPKPAASAYQHALHHMQTAAHHAVLFEDTLVNLEHAKKIGMRTVFLQHPRHPVTVPSFVDATYDDVLVAIQTECIR